MTQPSIDEIAHRIRDQFQAEVDVESVNDRGRFRLTVISPTFEGMAHRDRQKALWSVVDTVVDQPTSLDVSLILAFAPSEIVQSAM